MLSELVEKIKSNNATVCVLGLGRVGLPLAVSFANVGLNVVGVDIDRERVLKVNRGEAPFRENKLEGYLVRALELKKFQATTNSMDGIAQADIVMVTIGTPTTSQYYMDYSQLQGALEQIAKVDLTKKAIGFRCTLVPGTVNNLVMPYLEDKSGLKAGEDFALAMCPERILEGQAIEELHDLPEIVGGVNDMSNAIFAELFRKINPKKTILHTTPTAAELAKLFTNIYRYVNFALANEFAIWAEMYGEDAHNIIKVANYEYPRCRIPKPGFAGGPCLAKDGFLLDNNTTFSSIISTAWKVNEAIPQHVAESLRQRMGRLYGRRISVLGLAYKAGSDDTRLSLSVKLVEILKGYGATVLVHDPCMSNTLTVDKALDKPDAVIIAVNHPEFNQLAKRIDGSGCKVVYDVWGIFDVNDFQKASYTRFGRAK
jgi:UDP-N-acetyl-D-mannosaminuronic acid dehydrogenase